jgi:hypothetical protein
MLRWILIELGKLSDRQNSAKESLGYYELKKHKPWVNEEFSKSLDQRKQAKLQFLQD